MSDDVGYSNFSEFWPRYLQEHSVVMNQKLHFVGTNLSLLLLFISIAIQNIWLVPLAIFCGYFFAWIGHFFVQKNRPLTFKYPLMSLLADFKLTGLLWKKYLKI